jgi:hypothetical protein
MRRRTGGLARTRYVSCRSDARGCFRAEDKSLTVSMADGVLQAVLEAARKQRQDGNEGCLMRWWWWWSLGLRFGGSVSPHLNTKAVTPYSIFLTHMNMYIKTTLLDPYYY